MAGERRGRTAFPLMVACLVVLAAGIARGDDGTRGTFHKLPYTTFDGDATAMRVNWQLNEAAACTLDWGTDETYSLGSVVTTELGPSHQHDRRLTDLSTSTVYHYRVRTGAVSTGTFRTAPPADDLALKLIVYGDTRTYPATHDSVTAAILAECAADPTLETIVLMTGDLVADGNLETYWDTDFFDPARTNIAELHARVPVASARGNHEGTAVLMAKYLPYPWVYGRAWSFDYGPVHVAIVDQYTSYSAGSPQLMWLEDDLASSEKPWKIVLLHEPGWSAGGGHSNSTAVQTLIQPLCVEYGVQMVLGGHNHYYAHCLVDGVHHETAGGGGAPLHTPNLTYPYVVEAKKAHHFCTIEIDGNALTCTAIGKFGQVIDTFAVTHSGVPEAPAAPGAPEDSPAVAFAAPEPNPSTGDVLLSFTLARPSRAALSIYDVTGRLVRRVLDAGFSDGEHAVTWDGRDDAGRPVPSGVYAAQLETAQGRASVKIVRVGR